MARMFLIFAVAIATAGPHLVSAQQSAPAVPSAETAPLVNLLEYLRFGDGPYKESGERALRVYEQYEDVFAAAAKTVPELPPPKVSRSLPKQRTGKNAGQTVFERKSKPRMNSGFREVRRVKSGR